MGLFDFLEGAADIGSSGRGWYSWPAIGGAIVGAGVGGYLGFQTGGAVEALGAAGSGTLIGWLVGVVLRGVAFFLVIFLLLVAVTLGWEWLTGGVA